tara:strand:+ start:1100 stop:1657 length:558 start_codon:yes stop_codon:yes gene_type:complete
MKNIIILTAMFMLTYCGEVETTGTKNITNKVIKPESKVEEKVVSYDEYTVVNPVEINLDDMIFSDAFAVQHRAKGEGRTFWWRGSLYTTDLAELDQFVLTHARDNVMLAAWVTNNDDPDDNCRSNKLDDCGVCDGPGKTTWFRDKDRDGLGTFTEWITSCHYPTDIEIEKYQAESLLEGGGDQGH